MVTSWPCPLPTCDKVITESVPMVEALVISYARARHGELPDPVALAGLRRDRVAGMLDVHLACHTDAEIATWLAGLVKILPSALVRDSDGSGRIGAAFNVQAPALDPHPGRRGSLPGTSPARG